MIQRAEFTADVAEDILGTWHESWVTAGFDQHAEARWSDDPDFAQARLLGICHTMYVIPAAPYTVTQDGQQGYAIVDCLDPLPGTAGTVRLVKGYRGYHTALRVAAEDIASENEIEQCLGDEAERAAKWERVKAEGEARAHADLHSHQPLAAHDGYAPHSHEVRSDHNGVNCECGHGPRRGREIGA